MTETQHESKTKFLDAALHVIRAKGYSATRIEDVCETAGLTKGSFFHHFKSKEDLALAAAEHWSTVTSGAFASAPYRSLADPLDRVLAYVDFRKAILRGELPDFTCLAGTMVQEVYDTHPAIREACDKSISDHAAVVEAETPQPVEPAALPAAAVPRCQHGYGPPSGPAAGACPGPREPGRSGFSLPGGRVPGSAGRAGHCRGTR